MGAAAAAIGGGALLGGTILQSNATKHAARLQTAAANNATSSLEAAREQYAAPYNEAGLNALGPLTGLLTGKQYDPETGKSTDLSADQRDQLLYQTPGYKFNLDQQQLALSRSQAQRGNLLSGGAQKELAQYSSGLASQYYNDYINQLSNLAGIGVNAAGAALGTSGQIAGYQYQSGNALAQGAMNVGNIYGNAGSQAGLLAAFTGGGAGGAGAKTAGGGGLSTFNPAQINAPTANGYQFGRGNY